MTRGSRPCAGELACGEGEVFNAAWCDCRAPARPAESCAEDADCEAGLLCRAEWESPGFSSRPVGLSGICVRPPGAPGEPCGDETSSGSNEACSEGASCVYNRPIALQLVPLEQDHRQTICWADTGECVGVSYELEHRCVSPGLAAGEPCNDTSQCGRGLGCNGLYRPLPRCSGRMALGEPCSSSSNCASGSCQPVPGLEQPPASAPSNATEYFAVSGACDPRVDSGCDYWLAGGSVCSE